MNLRQAQRSLAELVSKCEEAHIQLPDDPLEARAEAVEAIIHSLKGQKVNLSDAQEELQQKFGLQLTWKQHLESEEAKRQRRRQKKTASRGAKAVPAYTDASKRLGSISEAPLLDDNAEVNLLENDDADDAQGRKAQGAVMTPAKRQAFDQGHGATARKVKHSRELLLAPTTMEEKAPAELASAAHGHDRDAENGSQSEASRSPNQSFDDLLEVGSLEDVGGYIDRSSDEDFSLE